MAQILVIHGPNLNLLGTREPMIYGSATLADIDAGLAAAAQQLGHRLNSVQSNAEHQLLAHIHQAGADAVDFIIINPGAFAHTSIALRDGLLGVAIPFIEVHISNVFAREAFRRQSYLSDVAAAVITGAGALGYQLALQTAALRLSES